MIKLERNEDYEQKFHLSIVKLVSFFIPSSFAEMFAKLQS